MATGPMGRGVRPGLEALEPRDVPSPLLTEAFDSTAVGALPAHWAQWSSTGSAAFAVTSSRALSAPHGLAVTTSASGLTARAWAASSLPANVSVSAAVYLDTAIPAQVLARGSGLSTAASSYYAVSVSSGLQLKLLRVVNGVSTTLGQLRSASWLAGPWVQVTLYANGPNLRAKAQRLDTGQYLNDAGQWQADPAWAINLIDTAITHAGLVGVGRPASSTGTVTFDNFSAAAVNAPSQPPALTVTAPAAGAVLSGVKPFRATATDSVGVARVEFYVDNVLRAVDRLAPYVWQFDTAMVDNGLHTLTVRAFDTAENVAQASLTFRTANDATPLPRPTIPHHSGHIGIAQLAYGTLGAVEDAQLRTSVDLVIVDSPPGDRLAHLAAVAPNTPRLLYTNVSNLYRGLLTDWLTYADAHGANREEAFYHVTTATAFSGAGGSTQPVNWFWGVYRGGTKLADLTWGAHQPAGTTAFGAAGESLYVGYPDRFREINVDLSSGAGAGWSVVAEYPTAVDAGGNPTAWATLPFVSDTTGKLSRSGRITFDPPADWKAASVGGSARLFYVRFRTTGAGTAPVARNILGRDYLGEAGTISGVIPVFDLAADTNHDGYLNDAEYAHRAPGKDARFLYESRALSYGPMRFSANPADAAFRAWAVDYAVRYLRANPLADGLFVDNSGGVAPVSPGGVLEPSASYATDYASLLYAVGKAIAPRWILANTPPGAAADPVVQRVQGYNAEIVIRALAHDYRQFESVAGMVARRAALTQPAPLVVLDSSPAGGAPTDARTQLATLAYYYLLADPATTYLDFFGGFRPASSWDNHFSAAATYDIGAPLGAWSLFAAGADPSNPSLSYRVYQRAYANALVLYKPLSSGNGTEGTTADGTATRHALGGTYRPLRADGTLGDPITSITLRNGEGAILVKAPA
jgi:hypothetical protein